MPLLDPLRDVYCGARAALRALAGRDRRLRVAFVGCGEHARTNLYPCLPHLPVELVAVCARRKERAERAAATFGARGAWDDFRAMFNGEALDAVIVSVGASEHFAIVEAALECGLHVFVEKPATRTAEAAGRLREIANAASRHVMVGLMKRHAPAYRKALALASDPSFGPIAAIDVAFGVGPFETEAGFLNEVAIHPIDLLRFFGGEVQSLEPRRHTGSRPDAFTIVATVAFKDGAVGTARLSTQRSWRADNERVELIGDGQAIVVENVVRLRHYRKTLPGGDIWAGDGHAFWEPNFTVPILQNQTLHLNGFLPELEHFVLSILANRPPRPDLSDFEASLRLVETIGRATPRGVA